MQNDTTLSTPWLFETFHYCKRNQIRWKELRDEKGRLVERQVTEVRGNRIDDVHHAVRASGNGNYLRWARFRGLIV